MWIVRWNHHRPEGTRTIAVAVGVAVGVAVAVAVAVGVCRGWCWARSGIRLVQKPDRKDRVNFNVIWSPSRLVVRPIKEADPSDFYRNTGSVIPSARLVCVRKTLVHRLASQSDAVREGGLRAE